MNTFDYALEFTLRWEGGFVHDPRDPGGMTYRGISRRAHPEWDGWRVVDAHDLVLGDVIATLEPYVAMFYRERYWIPMRGDDLPPRLALVAFDWAVHSGVKHASRTLQRLVGARADGVVGERTLAAVTDYADRRLAAELVGLRRGFLTGLVARKPKLEAFAAGWKNRMDALAARLSIA